jgi:hypothetical protein
MALNKKNIKWIVAVIVVIILVVMADYLSVHHLK